ncbi:HupE/UreJ family protein [Rhodobacteraceae bacterium D3-12]|nr:HupE/UreJ family protein [Rhodobacteraceae bacterium D3-12]
MKKLLIATAATTLAATPALAHHPLGGLPMETFSHGLMSGIGHPVLGFDHLFFVALMGVAALFTGVKRLAPAAYILAMMAGVLIVSFGGAVPMVETVIAISLLALGGIVLSGRAMSLPLAAVVFAGFGLFHGAAFGGPIAEQEAAMGSGVLIGYLIGLAVIQYAIALAAGWIAETLFNATEATAVNARLAGAMVAGVGVFLTLEVVEGPILSALFGV